MRGTFRAAIATNLTDRLPRIRASTLLVWGDQDYDTPLWMGRRMEELIPDAGLVVLEGAGHFSYADSPGRFRAVARQFLLEQPRQAAAKKLVAEEPPLGGGDSADPAAGGDSADPGAGGASPGAAAGGEGSSS
ncbi:MAG TPA: alpha/beta hydrolase, partial [Thermoleophilaceae bacterium]|nr:alpha/beta hydrolase [Thermoleophilaceae bacterium]